MKKVLMSIEGQILQIENPGEDFEIYEGPDATFVWVDAPDDVTYDWTLEYSPAEKQMVWVKREGAYTDPEIARKVAYGDIGEQLDMMYKDMMDGGTRWKDHITLVKNTYPAPPERPDPMTRDELLAWSETEEPSVDKPMGMCTKELPAWVRYPGWKGYQQPLSDA